MLIKKKNFKKKQLILKHIYKKKELFLKLQKSLLLNHYNNYIFRLSFSVNISNYSKIKNKFKTNQKLICLITLGKKVPSKHFFLSRFFLNKQLNSLKINNVSK